MRTAVKFTESDSDVNLLPEFEVADVSIESDGLKAKLAYGLIKKTGYPALIL